jgi:hypothetical protein
MTKLRATWEECLQFLAARFPNFRSSLVRAIVVAIVGESGGSIPVTKGKSPSFLEPDHHASWRLHLLSQWALVLLKPPATPILVLSSTHRKKVPTEVELDVVDITCMCLSHLNAWSAPILEVVVARGTRSLSGDTVDRVRALIAIQARLREPTSSALGAVAIADAEAALVRFMQPSEDSPLKLTKEKVPASDAGQGWHVCEEWEACALGLLPAQACVTDSLLSCVIGAANNWKEAGDSNSAATRSDVVEANHASHGVEMYLDTGFEPAMYDDSDEYDEDTEEEEANFPDIFVTEIDFDFLRHRADKAVASLSAAVWVV